VFRSIVGLVGLVPQFKYIYPANSSVYHSGGWLKDGCCVFVTFSVKFVTMKFSGKSILSFIIQLSSDVLGIARFFLHLAENI